MTADDSKDSKPFRVLALDGGGMRGLYTATLLETLASRFAAIRDVESLDIGKGFDLITGTSTGGILACGLAKGTGVRDIINLYRTAGPSIFHDPIPEGRCALFSWGYRNFSKASCDVGSLTETLKGFFNDDTLDDVYRNRRIALCIPAVNMATQQSWVFKTPHNPLKLRDRKYKIVDICLATSAAPMFLPIAAIPDPSDIQHVRNFVDGGLWANNPVLVGMIEALEMTPKGHAIEILSIGTCAPPEGNAINPSETNWGLKQWGVGSKALSASLDAQSSGYDYMAHFFARHLDRDCMVIRLPQSPPSPDQAAHLALDKATEQALNVLSELGKSDGDKAYRLTHDSDNQNGKAIAKIFYEMPAVP